MDQTTNEITHQGGPELPTGSVMVPEPPGIGVFGNTSITEVSKLPKKSGSTSRTNWTKELNKIVMRCYLKSNLKYVDTVNECIRSGMKWGYLS